MVVRETLIVFRSSQQLPLARKAIAGIHELKRYPSNFKGLNIDL